MTTALVDRLVALGLRAPAAHLDDVVALATKRRWSPLQLLEHLAETEQQERTRRTDRGHKQSIPGSITLRPNRA